MDFRLSETQSDVRDLFAKFFGDRSRSEIVRAAEPLGFDAAMWRDVLHVGALGMGLPDEVGGGGIGLAELIFTMEQMGRRIAPVPLVETVTAARLLARYPQPEVRDLLTASLAGERLITLGLRPIGPSATTGLVPAGAVADGIVVLRDGQLVVADIIGDAPRRSPANLGSMPLADCEIGGFETVLADGADAAAAFASALNEWKILTSAALVGLAGQAFEIGLDYVKIRKAFGTLIGSFQTVGHKLADNVVQLDGARFLCFEAAWAADERTQDAATLASMAFLYATETARRITSDSLHLHGGVGFTMEHDIQLYLRRAKAWPLILGDPRVEYEVLADHLYGPRSGQ
jgi:alkylation response protein AidB-like acyl-CoA dehydrogenase